MPPQAPSNQSQQARVRVVVTGIGLVTPLGLSLDENIERSLRGDSAIGPIRESGLTGRGWRSAAYVADFDIVGSLRFPKNCKFMTHGVACAVRAGREAIQQSGIAVSDMDANRVAIYTGSGQTGVEYENYFAALSLAWQDGRERDYKYLGGTPSRLIDPYIVVRTLANSGLALLACEFGIHGPSVNTVQGETAAAHALSFAYHDLVEGRADVAIAGGYDSLLTASNFLAFEKEGLLSPAGPDEAFRPFDRRRDGLVLGAGAAFVVLERRKDATARGATILGELCSVGCASDTRDALRPLPDFRALKSAIHQAPDAVDCDFVVACGIGTLEDDRQEAEALTDMVGSEKPVTALKSQTGYLGAATAVAEVALGLGCAARGLIPAVARHEIADPGCALAFVKSRPVSVRPEATGLFLSYAWGGQVAAITARTSRLLQRHAGTSVSQQE